MEIWLARASGGGRIQCKLHRQRAAGLCKRPDRVQDWRARSGQSSIQWRIVAGALCAASFLSIGCTRRSDSATSLEIQTQISPDPPRVGPNLITLRLVESGKALNGAHVAIEANMSHPGMRPQFAEAKETGDGRYDAGLAFPMAGDWVILVRVTLSDGKKMERQIDVRGVRPS
jgi:hypothetical protein